MNELCRAYKIETDRLLIRCYQPSDALLLQKAVEESLQHLQPWMPWAKPGAGSTEDKVLLLRTFRGKFDLGLDYIFGIFNKEGNKLIGSTGLHTRIGDKAREIGYWINVNELNKGYATEAVAALTKLGFAIEGLERIEIHCSTENVISQKIPAKLGYQLEKVIRKNESGDSENSVGQMIWTLFQSSYFTSPACNVNLNAFDVLGRQLKSSQ